MDRAVSYLRQLQWTDDEKDPNYGGFGYGSKGRADGSNLQIAIDALHDAGLKKDDPAYRFDTTRLEAPFAR